MKKDERLKAFLFLVILEKSLMIFYYINRYSGFNFHLEQNVLSV